MRIIVDASGNVLMWSEFGFPTPDVGQTAIDLSPDLAPTFMQAVTASPNGISFDGKTFASLPAPPPPIPQVVTPLQMRMALNSMGVRAQVDAYIAQQSQDMRDAWQFARFVPITNPMVIAVAQALNVDLNSLFKLASTYEH